MTTTDPTARASLRVPAGVMLAGQLLYIAVTQLHAGGEFDLVAGRIDTLDP